MLLLLLYIIVVVGEQSRLSGGGGRAGGQCTAGAACEHCLAAVEAATVGVGVLRFEY